MKDVEITNEPVELCRILKFENMVASGGEAKHVIAEGLVRVNGEVETRKRKKSSPVTSLNLAMKRSASRSGNSRTSTNKKNREKMNDEPCHSDRLQAHH
jgi:ribosome-associated protein